MNIRKIIKETINDFDFITKEPINPWLDYDGIVFDITPSKEEVNTYIELALNTRKDISNDDSWETDRERDINNIIRYQKRYGTSVLVIDVNNRHLNYSDSKNGYSISTRWINYSQLIGSNINESEDWSRWIEETEQDVMTFFQEGEKYDMRMLIRGIRHTENPLVFQYYDPDEVGGSYEDGRGILVFNHGTYTPLYIETRLVELGLILQDLRVS